MRGRAALAVLMLASTVAAAPTPHVIVVNQTGYLPAERKIAVLESAATTPVAWELRDRRNRRVLAGTSVVGPTDPTAGAPTQLIDFSAYRGSGDGFRIVAAGSASDRFAIRPGLYAPLARDALAFFYHQRAGVAIKPRFAGGKRWARPAAHAPERATCFAKVDQDGLQWPACAYTLDVTGGWYDAGDHGKYVVNGGISVWTLLNAYERGARAGRPPLPDGSLPLPEAGNGMSDLLDHARWEMAFLLSMQVPDGAQVAVPARDTAGKPALRIIDAGGMAHLKVADENWTKLPMPPHEDRERRWLYPPSTSATLNLAATAAQCTRIWRGIDDTFAARCLSAARRAWAAAERHPAVLATGNFTGSGGYGDRELSDEFWWAAAELLATTREERFRTVLQRSPVWQAPVPGEPGWPATAPLGTITLAMVDGALPVADQARMRAAIVRAADGFLTERVRAGYAIPFAPAGWKWGSTSNLLNRGMLLGHAADFTGDPRYRAAVIDTADYVLGRNPMRTSYVSGYGTRAMQHPHHRFWAPSLDPALPPPPPGAISGGPNSTNMSDPVALTLKGKCAAQRCWADHVDAYALNEVAINWNAPLAWVAIYLANTGGPAKGPPIPVNAR